MSNKRRNSKSRPFSSSGEISKAADLAAEERAIKDRIVSLDMTMAGQRKRRIPTSREWQELKKSILMAGEVLLLSLLILAILGVLNQKYHFLW